MKSALLVALFAVVGLTYGCATQDASREAVKQEVKEFVKKCNKNPSDAECVAYKMQNTSGGDAAE